MIEQAADAQGVTGSGRRPASLTARRKMPLLRLTALLLLALAAAIWWRTSAQSAVQYTTAPVTRGAISRAVTATGAINPLLTIIVGANVSGAIREIHCDFNTQVKRGQICARIDPRPYQAQVDQSKANLAVAKAQLEKDKASLNYARQNFERHAQLVASNAVSRDAYDNAKSNYEQAEAQIGYDEAVIQQRQAALDNALVDLDNTAIVSPVDGAVVSRNVTIGQTVASSFQTPTLFLIATDLSKMQVDTNVSESDIGGVKVGDKAAFTVDAYPKRAFEGSVLQVRQSPQTVQNVVTYVAVVAASNTDGALKPGMTAAVRIVTEQRADVLRVPNRALRYTPAGAPAGVEPGRGRVWALRQGRPQAVPVVTGLNDENMTEIAEGAVSPGDAVIIGERSEAKKGPPPPRF